MSDIDFKKLTWKDVTKWLDWQAERFTAMSRIVRATHDGGEDPDYTKVAEGASSNGKSPELSREKVRDSLKVKSQRTGALAEHFNVEKDVMIEFLKKHPDDFEIGEKGWVTVMTATTRTATAQT